MTGFSSYAAPTDEQIARDREINEQYEDRCRKQEDMRQDALDILEQPTKVFITPQMLGSIATDADATKMVALLRERGYDAQLGDGPDALDDAALAQFDVVFEECLSLL